MQIKIHVGSKPAPKPIKDATLDEVCAKLNEVLDKNYTMPVKFFSCFGEGITTRGSCANSEYTFLISVFSLFLISEDIGYSAFGYHNNAVTFHFGRKVGIFKKCLDFLNKVEVPRNVTGNVHLSVR